MVNSFLLFRCSLGASITGVAPNRRSNTAHDPGSHWKPTRTRRNKRQGFLAELTTYVLCKLPQSQSRTQVPFLWQHFTNLT